MFDEVLDLVFPLIFIWQLVLGFIWWIVLLPALWVISSPVVLILAIFSAAPFWTAVRDLFSTLTNLWNDWGLRFLP